MKCINQISFPSFLIIKNFLYQQLTLQYYSPVYTKNYFINILLNNAINDKILISIYLYFIKYLMFILMKINCIYLVAFK